MRGDRLYTPDVASDILESITRETVIAIAPETVGLPVVERTVDRSELYACEEAFWCGSGQEIVPILSVDRIPVGAGPVGPRCGDPAETEIADSPCRRAARLPSLARRAPLGDNLQLRETDGGRRAPSQASKGEHHAS